MVNMTKYEGTFVLEYFTDEQWKLLHACPKTSEEERAHRQLVNERFDAFRQIRRLVSDDTGENGKERSKFER